MAETLHHHDAALTRTDWFKAKLQCELGPVELKRLLDQKDSLYLIDVRDSGAFNARVRRDNAARLQARKLIITPAVGVGG